MTSRASRAAFAKKDPNVVVLIPSAPRSSSSQASTQPVKKKGKSKAEPKREPERLSSDIKQRKKPAAFFFPSKSLIAISDDEGEAIPCAYQELFDKLAELPPDFVETAKASQSQHDATVATFNEFIIPRGSKQISRQQLHSLWQSKLLYESILALAKQVEDACPVERAAITTDRATQEIVSFIPKLRSTTVGAVQKRAAKKRKKTGDDDEDDEEEAEAEEVKEPRAKRACTQKQGDGTKDRELVSENEEQADDGQAQVRIMKMQARLATELRDKTNQHIKIGQDVFEQLSDNAASEDLHHLAVHYDDLSQSQHSLLALIWPSKKELEIEVIDTAKSAPGAASTNKIEIRLQDPWLQMALTAPEIILTESEHKKLDLLVRSMSAKSSATVAAINALESGKLDTPAAANLSNSCIEYANTSLQQANTNALKQLIGVIGMIDGIVESDGKIAKDVDTVGKWIHEELVREHSSDAFKAVHPLSSIKDIAAVAAMTFQEWMGEEQQKLRKKTRMQLVEVANNVFKAITLLAVFGVGATESEMWKVLCRAGSQAFKHHAAEEWHIQTILSVGLLTKEPEQLIIPAMISKMVEHSPVTAATMSKWERRLQTQTDTRIFSKNGKVAIFGKAILDSQQQEGSDKILYSIATSCPSLIIEDGEVTADSYLLKEWQQKTEREKARLKTYAESLLELQEEDDE